MPASASESEFPPPAQLLFGAEPSAVRFADERARLRFAGLADGAVAWSLIKRNASRSVYRSADAQGPLYLKHFHSRSASRRLALWLGRCDARTEMRYMQELAAAGVSVPRPVAGCWRNGSHWLITEGAEPTVQGYDWHAAQLQRGDWRAIRQATAALAELVARMHQAGITHPDLHCGNVLVRTDDASKLTLIDLHRMERRRRLSLPRRAANLALLMLDRRRSTTRTDRLRFLHRYIRSSGRSESVRLWLEYIEHFADRIQRRYVRRCDRRILGNNGYFSRVRVAGYRGHVMLRAKCPLPLADFPDGNLTLADWKDALAGLDSLAGLDAFQTVSFCQEVSVGSAELEVLVVRSLRSWLRGPLGRAPLLREFQVGHRLLHRGILAAVPLAVVEKRRGPWLVESVLVAQSLSLPTIAGFLRTCSSEGNSQPEQALGRGLLFQLGQWLRRLHDEGFATEGLRAHNVLVQPHPNPQLVLAGLHGISRGRRSLHRQFEALAALAVSLQESVALNQAAHLRLLLGWLPPMTDHKPYWPLLRERLKRGSIA